MVYVLDTSAILSGKFFCKNIATTPKIIGEIQPKGHSYRLLETMKSVGLQVVTPPIESIKLIKSEAKRSGDDSNLSEADIEVLALAHYLGATLYTDDYAMQNVAFSLKIPYKKIIENGIKEHICWIYKCNSCGKSYSVQQKTCTECGGFIVRKRR